MSESIPVVVIDNHNHALYFWSEALSHREIDPGATLVHIDEHSDLWENLHDFELERENPEFLSRMAVFTNEQCNVGNYIVPAIRSGLISEVIRIE